jgi:hypothetical protein
MKSERDVLSVFVILPDATTERPEDMTRLVRYCDTCRRWGLKGTTHLCGENWSEHLAPVLAAIGGRFS